MATFEQIYQAHFQDVYRYLCRLCGDAHMAEEITSETFFKAMEGLDKFRGDCDIRVWLCQIAKNCYYTSLQKRKRTGSLPEALPVEWADDAPTPEERFDQKETAARIRDALHRLAEPYKEVFLWRVYAELSFRQIGQLFGKSENWACVVYHRAKNMIRTQLKEEPHEKHM